MSKQKITTVIFGVALFVFISISVPHLAWAFHSFEADGTGSWMDYAWWVLSYGEALSIDVLIFWLTVVQTSEHPNRTWVIWTFTFLLCVWSWFFNYLYTIAHAPNGSVWSSPLFGSGLTAGVLTPYLVSAIPLFILCYKFIHSLIERGAPESVEELAAKVADLEKRKGYEQQLSNLQAGKFTGFVKRTIASSVDIARFASNTARGTGAEQPNQDAELKPEQSNVEQQAPNAEPVTVERRTDPEQPVVRAEPIPIRTERRTTNAEPRTGSKAKVAALLANNPGIELAEIIAETGLSKSRASELRTMLKREQVG